MGWGVGRARLGEGRGINPAVPIPKGTITFAVTASVRWRNVADSQYAASFPRSGRVKRVIIAEPHAAAVYAGSKIRRCRNIRRPECGKDNSAETHEMRSSISPTLLKLNFPRLA